MPELLSERRTAPQTDEADDVDLNADLSAEQERSGASQALLSPAEVEEIEAEVAAPAERAAPAAPPSPEPAEANDADADSIAAYMERLLARTRRSTQADEEPAYTYVEPVRTPPTPSVLTEDAEAGSQDSPAQSGETTRPKIDPEELRARNASLRQVANLNARTSIATHAWKRTGFLIQVRVLLSLVSFGISGALFTGLGGNVPTHVLGATVAGMLGIGMLGSAAHSFVSVYSLSSSAKEESSDE
jgi:hypothetical protein